LKSLKNIEFKALLLLLIYLFSSIPSILFHHHNSEIHAHQEAAFRENADFIPDHGEKCNHKTQITTATQKCSLCDSHTLSPHSVNTFFTAFIFKHFDGNYLQISESYYFISSLTFSNRGPPFIFS